MNKVIPIKKRIEELESCAMCNKDILDNEVYNQIVMTFDTYVKHVAVCKPCYSYSLQKGIRFKKK